MLYVCVNYLHIYIFFSKKVFLVQQNLISDKRRGGGLFLIFLMTKGKEEGRSICDLLLSRG